MRYYFGRTHWLDAITPPLENHIAVLRDTILVNLGRELEPAKLPSYSQESSVEWIQLSEKPIVEEEPAIEPAEPEKSPLSSPRRKKSQKYESVICQFCPAVSVNFQGVPLGLEFRDWGPSVQLDYHIFHNGSWGFRVWRDGNFVEGIDGNYGLDFLEPITIINQSPTFIVYIDSSLLTLYNTREVYAGLFGLDFTVFNWDATPTETLTLELDNVKIWDLDKIEY